MPRIVSYLLTALLGALAVLSIQCSSASPAKMRGALKGPGPVTAAAAGITLATPMVSTQNYVTVTSLMAKFGATDAQTVVRLVYAPCDVNGIPIPGQPPIPVVLSAADVTAMQKASGSLRLQAYAALQANQSSLAGSAQ